MLDGSNRRLTLLLSLHHDAGELRDELAVLLVGCHCGVVLGLQGGELLAETGDGPLGARAPSRDRHECAA